MHDVLLIGSGITTAAALQSLAKTCRVVGVVRDVALAGAVTDEIARLAPRFGTPVFTDTSIRGVREAIDRVHPDCVVVSSYDRVLPADVLARCPFVNVHYAPLPRLRGRANVNWAVINQDPFTAITIHMMAAGLDAGDILFQRSVPISSADTVADLYERLNALQLEHLGTTVAQYLDGVASVQSQAEELATYGCTRVPADGEIDWSASTRSIDALVRALAKPFPGALTYVDGHRLTIWRAQIVDPAPTYEGRVAGRVIRVSRDEGVDVLTGDGVLRLFDVETAQGGIVPAASVIRSLRTTLGLRSADLIGRIEALERELDALRASISATGAQNVLVS
jgi:methionyl-tRNA formyltransferase